MNSLVLGHNAPGTRKNRNSIEIGASILLVAREGAKKTRIMYSANLSYGQLNRYLQLLTATGLLAHDGPKRGYKTTERGIVYLRQYSDYETSKVLSQQKESLLRSFIGT